MVLVGLACACGETTSEQGIGSAETGDGATTAAGLKLDSGRPSSDVICDGSGAMRLGITSGGGFVASTYEFTNPYGNAYLFVDGNCRYYASIGYMAGFATGTLSPAEAEQLTLDIGWERIAAWSSYRDPLCLDAGSSVITRAGVAATCICHCQDMGPAGLADAMRSALDWAHTLAARGERSVGPISAVAQTQIRPSGHELAWSLQRRLTSIPGLVQDENVGVTKFARFDAAGDLAALRSLRSESLAQEDAQFVPVLDQGAAYLLLARDDLPDEATTAIDALLASVP